MPLNPDAVGASSEPARRSWTSKDALLYAVGVGAGSADPFGELAFTTENTKDVAQQVLPTMAVVLGAGGGEAYSAVGEINWMMLVHGEQAVELHQPLPVEGEAESVVTVTGIYDKGSGALLTTETVATDVATGQPLFTTRSGAFIRGEGGWGGDRGPSGPRNVAPDRAPDNEVTYTTRADQALLYRLSGDRNPLHSDPSFAAMAGFDRPILHGLCSYGFTGRALLHSLCGSDPARFRSMEARFSSPVWPGDALTVSMWLDGEGPDGSSTAIFQTRRNGEQVVIDSGRCTFQP
jgi:acyl dehydratase